MIKPMLAYSKTPLLDQLDYPVIASPKLDGIRCTKWQGDALSRNSKLIPNKYVQKKLASLPRHLPSDGELMLKTAIREGLPPYAYDVNAADFNSVQSAIMSEAGEPNFVYCIFDWYQHTEGRDRNFTARERIQRLLSFAPLIRDAIEEGFVTLVQQVVIDTPEDLRAYFDKQLNAGYEGAMIKSPNAKYKNGRSTLKEQCLIKLKSFDDLEEATIIDICELMHNADTSCNKLENMIPGMTLGSMSVRDSTGAEFNIGSGFSAQQRAQLWAMRHKLIGKQITFQFQGRSTYGIPRFPVFKHIREDL